MALKIPEPPKLADDAVRSTFEKFVSAAAFRTPALREATAGRLELTQPHEVFTLGLDDLVAGRGLAAARPTGWRYLVSDGDAVIASAESVVGDQAGGHVFAQFSEGPFVASTAAAIHTADALPQASAAGFELRLLHVPGLYTMAVWLHDAGGAGDLLVTLAPSPVETPAGRPVAAADLLDELRAKATAAASVGPADRTGG